MASRPVLFNLQPGTEQPSSLGSEACVGRHWDDRSVAVFGYSLSGYHVAADYGKPIMSVRRLVPMKTCGLNRARI